jgi:hypothetical protein
VYVGDGRVVTEHEEPLEPPNERMRHAERAGE